MKKNEKQLNIVVLFIIALTFSYQIPIKCQHLNVMIGGSINIQEPEEPSIAINKQNTNEIVAGANSPNYYISTDAGLTWTHGILTSTFGVLCDPSIIADTAGAFYYLHLTNIPSYWSDRVICQKLSQVTGDWTNGTYFGINGTKFQDKEWGTVDPKNNFIYVTWTQFDQYNSADTAHHSNIRFSRSTDGGEIWSEAIIINQFPGDCLDGDNTVEGAVPTTGPNSEIYVAWGGPKGIVFDRSLDFGETWLSEDIFISDIPGGWAFDIPGINRCNGMPVTACDISNGPYNGNIYVNWSDQRNGTNDTDIWICRSTDGGHTWSDPLRVNDDSPGKQQFFTWMAIDQTNGYIYIVFYDRRNYEDNRTDVYLALSSDGGQTFSNHKISETPFTPTAGIFFGDYINIAAHNNVIRPIWTRMDQNNLSLWTAIVEPGLFTDVREINQIIKYDNTDNLKVHPNPFNSQAIINYHLEDDETVVIKVCDVLGKEIELLFVGHQTKGDHQAVWNAENMPSGVYIVRMVFNGITKSKKVILTK